MLGSTRSFDRCQFESAQASLKPDLNHIQTSSMLNGRGQQTPAHQLYNRPCAATMSYQHQQQQQNQLKPCYHGGAGHHHSNIQHFGSCTTLRPTNATPHRPATLNVDSHANWRHCKAHGQPSAQQSAYCSIISLRDAERLAAATCSCKQHWYNESAVNCAAAGGGISRGGDVGEVPNYRQSFRRASLHPHDCDYTSRVTDEDESVFPGFMDGDFRMLHRNIPALRRTGVNTNSIRQYYYPDGGWGWIICGVSFLVHVLTTGFQLSYGLLLFYTLQHLHSPNGLELLGGLNCAVSMCVAPLVVVICKRKSTRLLSVVGGLVLPLGVLFTSFATEFSQILFSYGFLVGIGVAMVRETCTIILGTYFKKKRHFVEMVAMSGEGVGIALFSVIIKEGVGETCWRQGLQIVAAMLAVSFFMGLFYRPASLYHPHRRAIEHLKNQQKKMRAQKPSFKAAEEQQKKKKRLFDASIIQSTTVRILLIVSCVSALGVYTPMFLMVLNAAQEGSDIQELVLLQAFLGIASTIGVVLAGALNHRPLRIRRYVLTTKVLSQLFLAIVAVSILLLSFIMGYEGLCILSWIYGIGFGGYRYSIKILALECVKLKQFPTIWGFMRGTESIPVLLSVPLTSFLNDYSMKYGRAGYYICSAAVAIAGIIIFFIGYETVSEQLKYRQNANNVYQELPTVTTALQQKLRSKAPANNLQLYDYEYQPRNFMNRSCVSLNQVDASVGCCGSRLRVECTVPQSNCLGLPCHGNHYKDMSFRQRPLQRSLSFIQPQYCYDNGQQFGRNLSPYQAAHYPQDMSFNSNAPLLCTCSPLSNVQSSKSRSVPEGLSIVSQQCSCDRVASKNFSIYAAHDNAKNFPPLRCTCEKRQMQAFVQQSQFQNSQRRQLRRSQSLSRQLQYIEQITTSV